MRPQPNVANETRKALEVLIRLGPRSQAQDQQLRAASSDYFRWLEPKEQEAAFPRGVSAEDLEEVTFDLAIGYSSRVRAVQQLRGENPTFHLGALWVVGATEPTDEPSQRVQFPLLSCRLERLEDEFRPADGLAFSPLVEAGNILPADIDLRTVLTWPNIPVETADPNVIAALVALAADAGFAAAHPTSNTDIPRLIAEPGRYYLVRRAATYLRAELHHSRSNAPLVDFLPRLGEEHTAFHTLYARAPDVASADGDERQSSGFFGADPVANSDTDSDLDDDSAPLVSAMPLTKRQRQIVMKSRRAPLQVITGAPGTGKSHTITAIVADALDRGESVLVAARTDAAVDALDELFRTEADLEPVLFGADGQRRRDLSHRLISLPRLNGPHELARLRDRLTRSNQRRLDIHDDLLTRLDRDAKRRGLGDTSAAARLRARLRPGLEDQAIELRSRLVSASRWNFVSNALNLRNLRALFDPLPTDDATPTDRDTVIAAVDLVIREQSRQPDRHDIHAPEVAPALVADFIAASRRVEDDFVDYLRDSLRSVDRVQLAGTKAIAAVGTALRGDWESRRTALSRLTDRSLTHAVPLWLGKLSDIGSILPPVPGLFDLTLIDEAASTEQRSGANALLRARRGVIVGDPRQLRPVSFLSDDKIEEAHERHEMTGAESAVLDVRRNSLFDAGVSAAVPDILDEHFRCAPHLIDLVAHRLYDDTVRVATQNPVSQTIDCVHLIDTRTDAATAPQRSRRGVVQAEIDKVLERLDVLRHDDVRSVGVVTPFRAQADAIESAVLASFTPDDIVGMELRVGTVHGFQGNERDHVLLSLGLIDDDTSGWRFVNDPNLMAVMLTRARKTMTVIASCTPDPATVLGQYIAQCDTPPGSPRLGNNTTRWTNEVASSFELAGFEVMRAYPCGRHVVDIAFAHHGMPIGITCELSDEGRAAHVDRHVELVNNGWTIHELLPALCDDDPHQEVLRIVTELTSSSS